MHSLPLLYSFHLYFWDLIRSCIHKFVFPAPHHSFLPQSFQCWFVREKFGKRRRDFVHTDVRNTWLSIHFKPRNHIAKKVYRSPQTVNQALYILFIWCLFVPFYLNSILRYDALASDTMQLLRYLLHCPKSAAKIVLDWLSVDYRKTKPVFHFCFTVICYWN